MKANELMVDDWVLHDGEPYQIRQLGIYGENRDGENYPAVCVSKPKWIGLIVDRNEIEPIPLTTKILEKNGWSYNNEDAKYAAETWVGNGLMLQENGVGYRIVVVSDYDDEDTNDTQFVITYIHQLQHALRLCGIDKEIII